MGSDPKPGAQRGTGVDFGNGVTRSCRNARFAPVLVLRTLTPVRPNPLPQDRFCTPTPRPAARERRPARARLPRCSWPARRSRATATSHGRAIRQWWRHVSHPPLPPARGGAGLPGKRGGNAGKPPDRWSGGFAVMVVRRCPTLPQGPPCSTIGAVRLSFRVRDVTGRFPHAMTTETL